MVSNHMCGKLYQLDLLTPAHQHIDKCCLLAAALAFNTVILEYSCLKIDVCYGIGTDGTLVRVPRTCTVFAVLGAPSPSRSQC